ncbi:MAG: hypothetical protein JWQ35_2085 [Bacteriovoracaceae bacterium]|nr:hypothetical protein [Bacteriovoracaceae bacterium]
MEAFTNTTQSRTEPQNESHPVKDFLEACGLDVNHFPVLKLIFESNEKELRTNRICVPLRIPGSNDHVYESFFRILRVLEVPLPSGSGHRKFLEIEWIIEPEPFLEKDLHPANSFLASEMSCPSCRIHFVSEPQLINDSTTQISCPQCLQQWVCNFQLNGQNGKFTRLLLDLMQKDPNEFEQLLKNWTEQPVTAGDSFYYGFFPFSFEKLEGSSSLEWLFGGNHGWSSLSNGGSRTFESLARGFLNSISLSHFKNHRLSSNSATLETTDIQIKTDIQPKEESVSGNHLSIVNSISKIPKSSAKKASEGASAYVSDNTKKISHSFSWEPTEFTGVNTVTAIYGRRRFPFGKTVAASLGLILFVGLFIYNYSSPSSATSVTQVSSVIINHPVQILAPEQAPTIPVESPSALPAMAEVAAEAKAETLPIEVAHEKIQKKTEAKIEPKSNPLIAAKIETKDTVKKLRKSLQKENSDKSESKVKSLAKAEEKISPVNPNELKAEKIDSGYREGMLHLKLHQGKEAIVAFQNVIDLDPKNADSYRGLGLAYFYDQQYAPAVKSFEKYLAMTSAGPLRQSVEEMLKLLREKATASLEH